MTTAMDQPKAGLSFGPFNLLAGERLLTKGGAPVELGARALDLLVVLISTPNEVVSKKELMARVWPDVRVEEGSRGSHGAGRRRGRGEGGEGARYTPPPAGRAFSSAARGARGGAPSAPPPASPT